MRKINLYNLMGKEPELRGLLKNKFEHREEEPDIDLWPAIEEDIRRKSGLWQTWKPYLAIAATLVVLVSVWILARQEPQQPQQVAETQKQEGGYLSNHDNYRRELATLEQLRKKDSEEDSERKNASASSKSKENEEDYFVPTGRSRQPLTLDKVERQQIAAATIREERQNLNLKAIDWEPEKTPSLANVEPEKINTRISPLPVKQSKPQKATAIQKINPHKTEIDLNTISLQDAVSFAVEKLNDKKPDLHSPVKVEEEMTKYGKKKTIEIKFFNVSITRKTYQPEEKTK